MNFAKCFILFSCLSFSKILQIISIFSSFHRLVVLYTPARLNVKILSCSSHSSHEMIGPVIYHAKKGFALQFTSNECGGGITTFEREKFSYISYTQSENVQYIKNIFTKMIRIGA